ncbi:LytS/YhcK type 5TM receptor domain-containing protein [Caldalkalibacillus mannanilyticus]|uniref:LytS/YhcK type 5TM receptor domain-containing protein n=1 Tax=Caldalkalibacillus mannanilyticus TaxID=1418 RepID=UPI0034E2F788
MQMQIITIELFERMGILLVMAFIVSRIPSFKFLLDREVNWRTSLYYSLIFGLFSMAGGLAGVGLSGTELTRSLWFPVLDEASGLAHTGIVGIVMAGLLGGPIVGLGAGLLAGFQLYMMGGITAVAYGLSSPFIGLLAGFSARFFSSERIISPVKSFFIGMFSTILAMCFIFIFTKSSESAILFVDVAGIPMVITTSLGIAIFTTMIRIVLNEKEQAQAIETTRALNIAERVLPFLKKGVDYDTAGSTAHVLMNELQPAAVAVTDTSKILAHLLGS